MSCAAEPSDSEFSIAGRLAAIAIRQPGREAISAPGRKPLKYGELWNLVRQWGDQLRELHIGRKTRIGVVLPPGPENAVAFLVIASHAVFVPFNPETHPSEWKQLFQEARIDYLCTCEGLRPDAELAAKEAGIRLLCLTRETAGGPAGLISLQDGSDRAGAVTEVPGTTADENDIALLIRTSGSTARPSWVPLHHGSLVKTALATAKRLELRPKDRCLHMLTFFHVHGLVSCVLCPVISGGAVAVTGQFNSRQFHTWVQQLRPTWYSAVPAIHRAILETVEGLPAAERSDFSCLRFIRSGAAPMDAGLRDRLRHVLGVDLVEAYGTTEAPQVSCNPVRATRTGSVGITVGPTIRIADPEGNALATGKTGEILLQGDTVFRGYDGEGNREAFRAGWFRTGDLGQLDADGYLYYIGRLKEMINRGGQKVAPIEIDTALCAHEAVGQAIAFAVPHRTLGEDLAAAVILEDGCQATELELRDFAAKTLPGFKVPSRILLVEDIPLGPTGKPQRIGLFDLLRDCFATEYVAPIGEDEEVITREFSSFLGVDPVGRDDNFFYLGGDSLKGQRTILKLADHFGLTIPPGALFRYPTVATLAGELKRLRTRDIEMAELVQEMQNLSLRELKRFVADH